MATGDVHREELKIDGEWNEQQDHTNIEYLFIQRRVTSTIRLDRISIWWEHTDGRECEGDHRSGSS